MYKKSERFGLVLTPLEKDTVARLAEVEGGLSSAALMRRLIRQAAQERGLWPSDLHSLHESLPGRPEQEEIDEQSISING
jgi:hypothetical protein